jgi:cell division inhibitor SepF
VSAMWNRTLGYLGLREEPEEMYDELPGRFVPEDDPYAAHAPERREPRRRDVVVERQEPERTLAVSGAADRGGQPELLRSGAVRAMQPDPVEVVEDNVRPLRLAEGAASAARTVSRVAQVEVTAFDDVEAVGARYRTGQAVLFDLSGTDAATARRVVDFVAGLTYALRGSLTKVGSRAFLLVPESAQVTPEERRRLTDLGYRVPAGSAT